MSTPFWPLSWEVMPVALSSARSSTMPSASGVTTPPLPMRAIAGFSDSQRAFEEMSASRPPSKVPTARKVVVSSSCMKRSSGATAMLASSVTTVRSMLAVLPLSGSRASIVAVPRPRAFARPLILLRAPMCTMPVSVELQSISAVTPTPVAPFASVARAVHWIESPSRMPSLVGVSASATMGDTLSSRFWSDVRLPDFVTARISTSPGSRAVRTFLKIRATGESSLNTTFWVMSAVLSSS